MSGPPVSGSTSQASVPDGATILPGSADSDGWHRLHGITPFLRSWKIVMVALAVAVQQGRDYLGQVVRSLERPTGMQLLAAGGALLLVLVVVGVWATLSWRMTRYRVRDGAIEHEVGILFRQHRQARLDRLQAVDVVQPLLGRVFGLSELRLEVAGGAGSDVRLRYLKDDDAASLRNTLLAGAAGVTYEGSTAPEAPQLELLQVGPGRLIASMLLGLDTLATLVALALTVVATIFERGAVLAAVPVVLGLGSSLWTRLVRSFGFSLAVSPDGLRLRHGLLETRSQTVPPGRVQAVQLSQSLLWRTKGWWQLKVNVAGYGGATQEAQQGSSTLLAPVATAAEAFRLLGYVLPDLGHPDATRLLGMGLDGRREDDFVGVPQRARWLDPFAWRRGGFAVTETTLLLRTGWLIRRLVLVPHVRTQSLALEQGPLQRRLRLAGVRAHSTPGPIEPLLQHLDAEVAGRFLLEQADRARHARSVAGPERWMTSRAEVPAGLRPGGPGVQDVGVQDVGVQDVVVQGVMVQDDVVQDDVVEAGARVDLRKPERSESGEHHG